MPWNEPENEPENKPFSQSTVTVVPSDLMSWRLFQSTESIDAESINRLFSESIEGLPFADAISTPLPIPVCNTGTPST